MNFIKKMSENAIALTAIVTLLVVFSGGLWKVWSMEDQIGENAKTNQLQNETLLELTLERAEERIDEMQEKFGDAIERGNEYNRRTYKRLKRKIRMIRKALGLEGEHEHTD